MESKAITNEELISIIVNDGRYKTICKKLVSPRLYLADDLYQETMLGILEVKDDRLITAYLQERLEVFIVGIINNIWHNRNRAKSYDTGSTSPLMEYSSTYNSTNILNTIEADSNLELNDISYDKNVRRVIHQEYKDYNPNTDAIYKATKKIVEEDCHSQSKKMWYMARVYNYSNNDIAGLNISAYDNPKQFAASSNIPYSSVYKAYCLYRKQLQKKLKHLFND